EVIGQHRAYFEPFCGSLAVLMAKPRVNHETVNDLHGDLTNLARVLSDERLAVNLYLRLVRTLPAEGLLKTARVNLLEECPAGSCDPERAYWYFVASWMAMSGLAGTERPRLTYAVRYTSTGGHGAQRFIGAVDSVPEWHARLRGVAILDRDAFEV